LHASAAGVALPAAVAENICLALTITLPHLQPTQVILAFISIPLDRCLALSKPGQ
jgi:hypothetical protein